MKKLFLFVIPIALFITYILSTGCKSRKLSEDKLTERDIAVYHALFDQLPMKFDFHVYCYKYAVKQIDTIWYIPCGDSIYQWVFLKKDSIVTQYTVNLNCDSCIYVVYLDDYIFPNVFFSEMNDLPFTKKYGINWQKDTLYGLDLPIDLTYKTSNFIYKNMGSDSIYYAELEKDTCSYLYYNKRYESYKNYGNYYAGKYWLTRITYDKKYKYANVAIFDKDTQIYEIYLQKEESGWQIDTLVRGPPFLF